MRLMSEIEARFEQPEIPWSHPEELPQVNKNTLYQDGFLVIESGDVIISPLIPEGRVAQDHQTIVTYVTPGEVIERLKSIPPETQGNEVSSLLNYVVSNSGSLVMIAGIRQQAGVQAERQIALTGTLIEQVQTQFPMVQIAPNVLAQATSLKEKLQTLTQRQASRRQIS